MLLDFSFNHTATFFVRYCTVSHGKKYAKTFGIECCWTVSLTTLPPFLLGTGSHGKELCNLDSTHKNNLSLKPYSFSFHIGIG